MHSRHSGPGVDVSGALGKRRMDPHGSVMTDPNMVKLHMLGDTAVYWWVYHIYLKFSMQDLCVKL